MARPFFQHEVFLSAMEHTECEAKFLLYPPHDEITDLQDFLRREHYRVRQRREILQVDHYFDTAGWDLFGRGWSFRVRILPGEGGYLTLKSIGGQDRGLHRRQEHEQRIEGIPNPIGALPPGEVRARLERWTNDSIDELRELFQVHTRRRRCEVKSDVAEFELCFDDVSIRIEGKSGETAVRCFREVEIELVKGEERCLERLARRIEDELHLLPARESKFQRGLDAAGLVPRAPSERKKEDGVRTSDKAILLGHQWLSRQFDALVADEVRAWEGIDPEGVHRMRVASRRLRVGLSIFRSCLPRKRVDKFLVEIKWITSSLGGVRDFDVHRANLDERTVAEGDETDSFRYYLDRRWMDERRHLIDMLSSKRYASWKKDFEAFLNDVSRKRLGKGRRGPTVRKLAKRLVGRALEDLRKEARKIGKRSSDKAFHRLRIRGKRLRYLLEIFAPVFPGELTRLVEASKEMQDFLGDYQDACVILAEIDAYQRSGGKHPKRLRKSIRRRKKALGKQFPRAWKKWFRRHSKLKWTAK